ncbi:unnamed protein product, partial [Mycena citricolor]
TRAGTADLGERKIAASPRDGRAHRKTSPPTTVSTRREVLSSATAHVANVGPGSVTREGEEGLSRGARV